MKQNTRIARLVRNKRVKKIANIATVAMLVCPLAIGAVQALAEEVPLIPSTEPAPNKETQLDEATINPVASLSELNVDTVSLENTLSWIEERFARKADYTTESFAYFEAGDGITTTAEYQQIGYDYLAKTDWTDAESAQQAIYNVDFNLRLTISRLVNAPDNEIIEGHRLTLANYLQDHYARNASDYTTESWQEYMNFLNSVDPYLQGTKLEATEKIVNQTWDLQHTDVSGGYVYDLWPSAIASLVESSGTGQQDTEKDAQIEQLKADINVLLTELELITRDFDYRQRYEDLEQLCTTVISAQENLVASHGWDYWYGYALPELQKILENSQALRAEIANDFRTLDELNLDSTVLEGVLAKAKEVKANKDKYTPESFALFEGVTLEQTIALGNEVLTQTYTIDRYHWASTNYSEVIDELNNRFNNLVLIDETPTPTVVKKELTGPTTVESGSTHHYEITLTYSDGHVETRPIGTVEESTFYIVGLDDTDVMTEKGNLTFGKAGVRQFEALDLQGVSYGTLTVTVAKKDTPPVKPTITSTEWTVTGDTTVQAGEALEFSLTEKVTYSDGEVTKKEIALPAGYVLTSTDPADAINGNKVTFGSNVGKRTIMLTAKTRSGKKIVGLVVEVTNTDKPTTEWIVTGDTTVQAGEALEFSLTEKVTYSDGEATKKEIALPAGYVFTSTDPADAINGNKVTFGSNVGKRTIMLTAKTRSGKKIVGLVVEVTNTDKPTTEWIVTGDTTVQAGEALEFSLTEKVTYSDGEATKKEIALPAGYVFTSTDPADAISGNKVTFGSNVGKRTIMLTAKTRSGEKIVGLVVEVTNTDKPTTDDSGSDANTDKPTTGDSGSDANTDKPTTGDSGNGAITDKPTTSDSGNSANSDKPTTNDSGNGANSGNSTINSSNSGSNNTSKQESTKNLPATGEQGSSIMLLCGLVSLGGMLAVTFKKNIRKYTK